MAGFYSAGSGMIPPLPWPNFAPPFPSQEKLAQIARNIADSGEDPAEFIDTKLTVSERKYGALPEAWRKGFEPARTVKVGALKVTLEPAEAQK